MSLLLHNSWCNDANLLLSCLLLLFWITDSCCCNQINSVVQRERERVGEETDRDRDQHSQPWLDVCFSWIFNSLDLPLPYEGVYQEVIWKLLSTHTFSCWISQVWIRLWVSQLLTKSLTFYPPCVILFFCTCSWALRTPGHTPADVMVQLLVCYLVFFNSLRLILQLYPHFPLFLRPQLSVCVCPCGSVFVCVCMCVRLKENASCPSGGASH